MFYDAERNLICFLKRHNYIDFGCLCLVPYNHDRSVIQYVFSSQQAKNEF
jgi:hypothetical protein